MTSVYVSMGLKLVSEANARDHWRVKADRVKRQRNVTLTCLQAVHGRSKFVVPLVVTITRRGKRRLDSDNLQSSAKAVRDGVADWLGIDDGHEGVEWRYVQEIDSYYTTAVRVEGAA